MGGQNSEINNYLLELDNCPELAKFSLPDGFLLWLHVRYSLYNAFVKKKQNIVTINRNSSADGKSNVRPSVLTTLFRVYFNNPLFNRKKYNGLIFSTTMGCIKGPTGRFTSKINHYFNQITTQKNLNILLPGANGSIVYDGNYAYSDWLMLRSSVQSKFSRSKLYFENDIDSVRQLFTFLRGKIKSLLDSEILAELEERTIEFVRLYPFICRNVNRMLIKKRARFVVMEDGNYGGDIKMVVVRCANILGLKTIEMQHGLFDIGMKYGAAIRANHSFEEHKTGFVFTFGKFWNRFLETSSSAVTIGYPYLEEKIKREISIKDENILLFVSQARFTDVLISMADIVATHFVGRYKVIYRLHPSESDSDSHYAKLRANPAIRISQSGDIYSLLGSCSYVIGIFSALLFEAQLVNKTALVLAHPLSDDHIPAEIGIRFTDATDIIRKIEDKVQVPSNTKDDFWATDWENNLSEFNNVEKLW